VTLRAPDTCRLHDAVEVRTSPIEGRGLFATAPIAAGEVVMRLGGRIVTRAELDELIAGAEASGTYVDCISVDDGIDLVMPSGHDIHFGNHGCDPNVWHTDAFTLVARRDIAPDEEIVLDYATQADNAEMSFACSCGSAPCRGVVTGADWRRPELQERYGDHWTPVLLRRIAGISGDRR
jgi:SET domain-containing protein